MQVRMGYVGLGAGEDGVGLGGAEDGGGAGCR